MSLGDPRKQKVFSLNIKGNKILHASVEKVHYSQGRGTSEITAEGLKAFYRRYWPKENYDDFAREVDADPSSMLLDTENLFTQSEKMDDYKTLVSIIRKQGIEHPIEKGWLAVFLIVHQMRSHAIMESLIEWGIQHGEAEFEFFLTLKHLWGDANFMFDLVRPVAFGCWTFYIVDADTFPLCDNPILHSGNTVMVALSPRMLLEIDTGRFCPEDQWKVRTTISDVKLDQFRCMTIANTFREIIFGRKDILGSWQRSAEFEQRRILVTHAKSYNELLASDNQGELWKLNVYGNTLGRP